MTAARGDALRGNQSLHIAAALPQGRMPLAHLGDDLGGPLQALQDVAPGDSHLTRDAQHVVDNARGDAHLGFHRRWCCSGRLADCGRGSFPVPWCRCGACLGLGGRDVLLRQRRGRRLSSPAGLPGIRRVDSESRFARVGLAALGAVVGKLTLVQSICPVQHGLQDSLGVLRRLADTGDCLEHHFQRVRHLDKQAGELALGQPGVLHQMLKHVLHVMAQRGDASHLDRVRLTLQGVNQPAGLVQLIGPAFTAHDALNKNGVFARLGRAFGQEDVH